MAYLGPMQLHRNSPAWPSHMAALCPYPNCTLHSCIRPWSGCFFEAILSCSPLWLYQVLARPLLCDCIRLWLNPARQEQGLVPPPPTQGKQGPDAAVGGLAFWEKGISGSVNCHCSPSPQFPDTWGDMWTGLSRPDLASGLGGVATLL